MNTLDMLKEAKETGCIYECTTNRMHYKERYVKYNTDSRSYEWCDCFGKSSEIENLSINKGVMDWNWKFFDYELHKVKELDAKAVELFKEISKINEEIYSMGAKPKTSTEFMYRMNSDCIKEYASVLEKLEFASSYNALLHYENEDCTWYVIRRRGKSRININDWYTEYCNEQERED